MLGEACLIAGVWIFVALLTPANWRPMAGGVALGAQFVVLWLIGRRPVIGHDGGTVVPASAALLLALTALLTVLTPWGPSSAADSCRPSKRRPVVRGRRASR